MNLKLDNNCVTKDKGSKPQVTAGCSREPALVKKLAKIKEQQARSVMGDARTQVNNLKRTLRLQVSKVKYLETLKRVSAARSKAWTKATTRHKKKMDFLWKRNKDCCDRHRQERVWQNTRAGKRDPHPRGPSKDQPLHPDGGPAVDTLLSATKVTDHDLNYEFGDPGAETAGQEVTVFGEVELDGDERALLARRPEFAIYDAPGPEQADGGDEYHAGQGPLGQEDPGGDAGLGAGCKSAQQRLKKRSTDSRMQSQGSSTPSQTTQWTWEPGDPRT